MVKREHSLIVYDIEDEIFQIFDHFRTEVNQEYHISIPLTRS
jgi:hypothetical protein